MGQGAWDVNAPASDVPWMLTCPTCWGDGELCPSHPEAKPQRCRY